MRRTYSLLFCVLLSISLYAQNQSAVIPKNNFKAYPAKKTILQNSCILLEGTGVDIETIKSFDQSRYLFLQSEGGHKVKMMVIERHMGMLNVIQILLRPLGLMSVGGKYTLMMHEGDENKAKEVTWWDADVKKYNYFSWTIKEGSDKVIPRWIGNSHLVSTDVIWKGSGASSMASFKLHVEDQSGLWVYAELIDVTRNKRATYILTTFEGGILQAGHANNSGAFTFEINHDYKIRFRLIDYCGNTDADWTEWVFFKSPHVHKKGRFEDRYKH